MSLISAVPSEEEVLFTANSCFKVLAVEESKIKPTKFVLAEVDRDGNVIAKLPEKAAP